MLIVGIDRRLLGVTFILAVIVGANDGSKIAAGLLFFVLAFAGRLLSRKDPNIFLVMNRVRQQKPLYDPVKREYFVLQVDRRRGSPWSI